METKYSIHYELVSHGNVIKTYDIVDANDLWEGFRAIRTEAEALGCELYRQYTMTKTSYREAYYYGTFY